MRESCCGLWPRQTFHETFHEALARCPKRGSNFSGNFDLIDNTVLYSIEFNWIRHKPLDLCAGRSHPSLLHPSSIPPPKFAVVRDSGSVPYDREKRYLPIQPAPLLGKDQRICFQGICSNTLAVPHVFCDVDMSP